jgi:hypothetical protein
MPLMKAIEAKHYPKILRLWILGDIVWATFRLFVARATLRQYGLNIWLFCVVEYASIVPYIFGSAKCVKAFVAKRHLLAAQWAAFAALGFISPELFIVATTKKMPWHVYIIIAIAVSIFGTAAAIGLVKKVRKERLQESQAR